VACLLIEELVSHIGRARDGLSKSVVSMIHVDGSDELTELHRQFEFQVVKHFKDVCLCALSLMQQTSVCAHSLC